MKDLLFRALKTVECHFELKVFFFQILIKCTIYFCLFPYFFQKTLYAQRGCNTEPVTSTLLKACFMLSIGLIRISKEPFEKINQASDFETDCFLLFKNLYNFYKAPCPHTFI